MKTFIALLIIFTLFSSANILHAQFTFPEGQPVFDAPTPSPEGVGVDPSTGLPIGLDEQFSTYVTPSVPKPGEQVQIEVESFATNLNKASIQWTVDGEVKLSGIGERIFNTTAPISGKTSVVRVRINKEGGGVITDTITIAPSQVVLLYEAQTYTPPFYQGKALFTPESTITLAAIPNFITSGGRIIPKEELVYTWEINGQVIQSASGYGKHSMTYTAPLIYRETRFTVTVSAVNSDLIAQDEIRLDTINPEVVLYERNPRFGTIFEQAIEGNFTLDRSEVELTSKPYFFAADDLSGGSIQYEWTMNGKKASISPFDDSLTFRVPEGSTGRSNIGLRVKHVSSILQTDSISTTINFTESSPQGTFDF